MLLCFEGMVGPKALAGPHTADFTRFPPLNSVIRPKSDQSKLDNGNEGKSISLFGQYLDYEYWVGQPMRIFHVQICTVTANAADGAATTLQGGLRLPLAELVLSLLDWKATAFTSRSR